MTDRHRRFLRLQSMRETQHKAALTLLRNARIALQTGQHQTEQQQQQQMRDVQDRQTVALEQADHQEWMLLCATGGLCSFCITQSQGVREELQQAVTAAEETEARTRQQLRQAENVLDSIRTHERAEAAANEQKRLDEAAQVLRARSSNWTTGLTLFS